MTEQEIRRAMSSPTSVTDTSTSLLNHFTEGAVLLDRDRSIIAQNAGTTAANIVATAVQAGTLAPATLDELVEAFDNIRTGVFNGTLALAGAEAVVERFTDEPSTPTNSGGASAPSGGGDRPHADLEVRIGKFRGKTIGHIYDNEDEGDGWLEWASQNLSNDFLKTRIREFLAAA